MRTWTLYPDETVGGSGLIASEVAADYRHVRSALSGAIEVIELEPVLDLLANWFMGTNPRPINVNGGDTIGETEALLREHGRLT